MQGRSSIILALEWHTILSALFPFVECVGLFTVRRDYTIVWIPRGRGTAGILESGAQCHFLSPPRISSLGGGDGIDSHLWHPSLQTRIKKRALSMWTFSIAEGLWLAQCWVTCPPVQGVAISLKSWGHLLILRSWQDLWLVASPDSYKSGERRGIRSIFLGLLGKKIYIFFIIIILPLSMWDKVLYGKNLPLLIGSGHRHWFF